MRLFKSGCAFALVSSLVACATTEGGSGTEGSGSDTTPQVAINGGGQPAPGGSTVLPDGTVIEQLGTIRGHWNGKTLTFEQTSGSSGIKAQAFVQVPDASLSIQTDQAIAVTTSCPQNVNPAYGYYAGPTPQPMANSGTCPNDHLCGLVTLTNQSSRDLDRVYMQLTNVTPGFVPDGPAIASVPQGYPLDASQGLFAYGSLPMGGIGGAQAQLNFPLANCNDFYFDAKIMGTVRRTSYAASLTTLPTQDEWIDACSLPGMTRVLQNAGPNAVTGNIAMPFPFTLYDLTFDADQHPNLRISSNGALGFTAITSDHIDLPDTTGASNYSIFPFWTQLDPGANGVCYGSTGATPNRKFVVTWTNADIVGSAAQENMTFSAVLNESSDMIQFYYQRHSDNQTDCQSTAGPARGSMSTIGVQGQDANGAAFWYNDPIALGAHDSTCLGNLDRIVLTPSPGNTF